MNRLNNIINNKTIALIVHGPSIEEMEERIWEFRDFDLCYASINHFRIVEDNILSKISKRLDLVYCSAPIRIRQETENLKEFMDRKDNNLWITYEDNSYNPDKTLHDKGNPGHGKVNTLFAFLMLLIKIRVRRIILFGADGGAQNKKTYYKQNEFELDKSFEVDMENKWHDIYNDTKVANEIFRKMIPLNETEILNCSKESKITCFKKIDYDEAINLLEEEKCQFTAEKK